MAKSISFQSLNRLRKPALLTYTSSRKLLFGCIISMVGDQFTMVAFPWLALKLAGDTALLAASAVAMSIPRVVLLLAGGVIADRYHPKRILIASGFINGLLLAVLGITELTGTLTATLFVALALCLGISSAVAMPSGEAMLPLSIPAEHLSAANSSFMIIRQVVSLLGPLAASSLIAWAVGLGSPTHRIVESQAGIGYAFVLDAASCVISAWVFRSMCVPTRASTDMSREVSVRSVAKDISAGFRFLWKDRLLKSLSFYYAVVILFVAGPNQIGLPVLAELRLGHGVGSFGLLLASFSFGALLGGGLAGIRHKYQLTTLGTLILVVDAMYGFALVGLGCTTSPIVILTLCILTGFGGGFVQIAVTTWIQARIPVALLGRTMSAMMFIMLGIAPLSAALTGAILKIIEVPTLFVSTGLTLSALAVISLSNPILRSIKSASTS